MLAGAASPPAVADGSSPLWFVGLMSGTSLDGVDAALVDFAGPVPRLEAHVHRPYSTELRATLGALCVSAGDEIEVSSRAALSLASVYTDAVMSVLQLAGVGASSVVAIGAHGQTVRHRPDQGYSVQLNAPARLAELTGIDVIADFRSRDLAAGGHGAPLVPAFHAQVFLSNAPRAIINVGGISNITSLMNETEVIGFDCGPGNVLLDAWTQKYWGTAFDQDGLFAARGQVDPPLLARMLQDPYFMKRPPKSTGRELFSAAWLDNLTDDHRGRAADVLATLTELTARSIADAIERWCPAVRDLIVCGGGARNVTLMNALSRLAAPRPVQTSAALGIAPEHVEAMAFAWLARAFTERRFGNLPSVTGARGLRVLGALYPA
jgi:anhydro-N-acetylmuramic acid kinase